MIYNRPTLSQEWSLGGGSVNVLSDYPPETMCECGDTWANHRSGWGARSKKRIDLCLPCKNKYFKESWIDGKPSYEILARICMEFKEKKNETI